LSTSLGNPKDIFSPSVAIFHHHLGDSAALRLCHRIATARW